MFRRRLLSLIPNNIRLWYRNRALAQEATDRRIRHSKLLSDEYLPYQFEKFRNAISERLRNELEPLLMNFNQFSNKKDLVALRWDDSPHDLYVRQNTSDIVVLVQVLLEKQYEPALHALRGLPGAAFIDCGANVGLSSRYFLDAMPDRRAVLIEPSQENIQVLRKNLSHYDNAVEIVLGALWHTADLSFDLVDTGLLEYGLKCAVKQDIEATRGGLRTYTMDSLLALVGGAPIGLAKIDIEGGEAAIFSPDSSAWIGRIGNIAIEIHGETCARIIQTAMSKYSFETENCGEITMFTNIRGSTQIER